MSHTRNRTGLRTLILTAVGCSLLAIAGCGDDGEEAMVQACLKDGDLDQKGCECMAAGAKDKLSDNEYEFMSGVAALDDDDAEGMASLMEDNDIDADAMMSIGTKMEALQEECKG